MKKQHGAATLLIVVSLLALAALALLYSARHVVLEHFNAQAQHRYHVALGYAEEGLAQASHALEHDGSQPVSPDPARYQLSYQASGTQLQVISSGYFDGSTVKVQRQFVSASTPPAEEDHALQINHDLHLSGAINIIGGKDAKLTVDGDVTLDGSVQGIDTLLATGSITVNGNQRVNVLNANGNITVTNGQYQRITTLADLITRDSAKIGLAQAKGSASIGSTRTDQLQAVGNVAITNGGSSLGTIETQGAVVSRTSSPITTLKTEGDLTVEGWGGRLNAQVGGRANYNKNNNEIKVQLVPGLQVPLPPLTPVSIRKQRVDANDYRNLAHYLFTRDPNGKIRVRVRAVNGIADGDYFVGKNQKNHENYLCSKTDGQNKCTVATAGRLCRGYSDYNSCLNINSKGDWLLEGNDLAPGIAWFDGNLIASNGKYFNSFLASGNIQTRDNHQTYAVNYIGYAGVCANKNYPGQYPTDYCDLPTQQFTSQNSGNIAYLAGHYQQDRYVGGDITLGSSSTVHGNVIAGNTLNSGGRTVIKGYVTVANQGTTGDNNWGNSTTIDLTDLPDSFKPGGPGTSEPPGPGAGSKYQPVPGSWIDSGAGT